MNKKYSLKISAFLTATLLSVTPLPCLAEDPNVSAISNEPEAPAALLAQQETPTTQSITIKANYYPKNNAGSPYIITFTAMTEIPAFKQLTFKVSLTNATLSEPLFASDLLTKGTSDNLIGNSYALYNFASSSSATIPAKTLLCTIVTDRVPTASTLQIQDFSAVLEDDTTLSLTVPAMDIASGPVIPTLDTKTQDAYDAIVALPSPETISFYQTDGSLINIPFWQNKIEAASKALQALNPTQRLDLGKVMAFYEKTLDPLETLPPVLAGMQTAYPFVEIAKVAEGIREDNALSYLFLPEVYQTKNVVPQGLLEGSTAKNEWNTALTTMETAAQTVATAKEAIDQSDYRNRATLCENQILAVKPLGSHPYYNEYLQNIETQISAIKTDVNQNVSDEIEKRGLLAILNEIQEDITFIKQGQLDFPVMQAQKFQHGSIFTLSFTRKNTLAETHAASVCVEITDKNGLLIDAKTVAFPAASKSIDVSFTVNRDIYNHSEYYTVTAFYILDGSKLKFASNAYECQYNPPRDPAGLPTTNPSQTPDKTPVDIPTPDAPVGGGTIFPDSAPDEEIKPPTEQETPLFADLKNYGWAEESIEALYDAGIINGMDDGLFHPSGLVTREQFAKMVVQLFGIASSGTNTAFLDVNPQAWYAPYITAAMQAGYIQGQSDEYFGIGESIMRQDMATILYRALGDQNSKAILSFTDADSIAPYANDAIATLVGMGVINGYEDGSLNPRGTATRAEAAKMIYGIYKHLNR